MAAFEERKDDLGALGVTIIGASVDTLEDTQAMVDKHGLTFPMAYGVTKADAEALGAWWSEGRGGFIQPSEFLLRQDGKVIDSLYASGPVGRLSAAEAVVMITGRVKRRLEKERGGG